MRRAASSIVMSLLLLFHFLQLLGFLNNEMNIQFEILRRAGNCQRERERERENAEGGVRKVYSSESCQFVARWPSGKIAVHEGVVMGSGL